MNGNLVHLVPSARVPREGVVNLIKEFLAKAESGELSSVAVIGSVPDGVQYACSIEDVPTALGSLELLKQEILRGVGSNGE